MELKLKQSFLLALMCFLFSCSEQPKTAPASQVNAQNKTLYQSTDDSFRKDFFLVFEEKEVTLYGWEINSSKDTVYYRSTTHVNDIGSNMIRFTFENYDLSKEKNTLKNLHLFKPDNTLECYPFLLHNSFSEKRKTNQFYEFIASKPLYDSNCDEFKFELVKL